MMENNLKNSRHNLRSVVLDEIKEIKSTDLFLLKMTDVTDKNTIVPFFSFKVNMLNLTWKEK